MKALLRWFARPWFGVREARREYTQSLADQPSVSELAAGLDELHRENHITEKVHAAMRGGKF